MIPYYMLRALKYPNLAAEYNCTTIYYLAGGANVTPELMMAVIRGKEDLTASEAFALCRRLGCECEYLFSPKLSLMNWNKYRHRRWANEIARRLKYICIEADGGDKEAIEFINSWRSNGAIRVLEAFAKSSDSLTYADYRNAEQDTRLAIGVMEEKRNKPRGLAG